MLEYLKIYEIVKEHFIKHSNIKRFEHSERVVDMALKLNAIHNLHLDVEKLKITAIIHDYAKVYDDELIEIIKKEFENDKLLLQSKTVHHAIVGDIILKNEFGIDDEEILDAVKYHTTGKPNMSTFCKVIFLADYIEMGRSFESVNEVRNIAFNNLDNAVLKALEITINYIKSLGYVVYPLTIDTYNYYKKGE